MNKIESPDLEGFEVLIRKNYTKLWNSTRSYVQRRGGSEEMSKDILQEAIIRVYEKGKDVKSEEFNAYAFGFIKHVTSEMLRKNQRESRRISRVDAEDGWKLERLTDEEYQSDRFDHDDHLLVMQLIDTLGKDCKELLITYYVHGHSNKDLAAEYSTSESYIKVKKNRCMKQLRDKFDQ